MAFKDAPIRRKLMAIILLTTMAALLLTRVIFFSYEFLAFRQALIRQLGTIGKIIAGNCNGALTFENQKDAQDVLSSLNSEPHLSAAVLYDKAGTVFARYPTSLKDAELPATPEAAGYAFKELSLRGFQPVVQDGKVLGTLYLKFETREIMSEWLQSSIAIAVIVLVVVLVLAYLISTELQKRISLPILSLSETARAVSDRRDYSVRATKTSNDELGRLTEAFNQMLAQIQTQDSELHQKEDDLRKALEAARKAEEEVRQTNQELEFRVACRTEQLETANQELESFSYSVSHDLRAPLRHIQGYAEMLGRSLEGQMTDKSRRYLKTILDSGVQMGQLIDDLLAFSRLGRSEVHEGRVALDNLVRNTLENLELTIQNRNIVWKIPPLPVVLGDPSLLKQVFANLIGNALKYSRERDPAQIEIGCSGEESGRIIFFVRDNGAGFDMRYANKLFGVFQRLHRAEEFEGTGIGLATVRRIIARHGGRTWAEGVLNQGATFYFTLRPAAVS